MTATDSLDLRLSAHGIRPTPNRRLVLAALDGATCPIALADLETILDTVDRSAIFRSLNLFRSIGLVHVIDDGSGSTKYELCREESHTLAPAHLHAHFHCSRCGATVCLPDIPVPAVALPPGYIASDANFVVTGLCPSCSPTGAFPISR
ncbi:MAG: transcriptional repressor [Pseudoflavonifractor sp.]|nr:transcriptional repressor [Alloprevotella sp.]MCM1116938.1 transcriptional repressor [Pseudoflavonifractor sp.]